MMKIMEKEIEFIGSRFSDSVTERAVAHSHPYYELNFMTRGKTKMILNDNIFDFNSFDFILIPPGVMHLLHESDYSNFENYVIWFRLLGAEQSLFDNKIVKLHDYDGIVQTLCKEIFKTYETTKMEEVELISYYLNAVMIHFRKGLILDVKKQEENESAVEKALKYINVNAVYSHVSVKDVADHINCSTAHLSREFHKKYGVSPIEYIIGLKMAEAKRMLIETTLSIKQISEKLLYSEQLYFSRQFHKKFGVSPKEYRITMSKISKKSI